ncbi:unnamed protein product [Protopolystoma xenopodis]|uniref:Trematode PH-like domain-containing protein n=1 Tax=Protopolystoma xenopodis TaxID=117903 RepID=A0A448XIX8_9PLAT|nr:unnamed protein product [Protopolystoma xenopodis]
MKQSKNVPMGDFKANVQIKHRSIFPGDHMCSAEEASYLLERALNSKSLGNFTLYVLSDRLLLKVRNKKAMLPWSEILLSTILEVYKFASYSYLAVLATETPENLIYDFILFSTSEARDNLIRLLSQHSKYRNYHLTSARPEIYGVSSSAGQLHAGNVVVYETTPNYELSTIGSQRRGTQTMSGANTLSRPTLTVRAQSTPSLMFHKVEGNTEWIFSSNVLLLSHPELGPNARMDKGSLLSAVYQCYRENLFGQYHMCCYNSYFSLQPLEETAPKLLESRLNYKQILTFRCLNKENIPVVLLRGSYDGEIFFHIVIQFELTGELRNFKRIFESQLRYHDHTQEDMHVASGYYSK